MASDIQRLRQQSLFNIAPQMDMGGGMDMGGYEPEMAYSAPAPGPMGGAYRPLMDEQQEPQSSPFDFLKPQQPSPTFPSGPSIAPGQTPADPNKQAAGTTPLASQSLEEYIAMINKGYTPDFTDRDRLRKLMDEAPVRNSPSLARSIVAAAMSTKAEDPVKTAEAVQYAPYYRDKADWLAKTEPFYKTADLENRQNINERTLMTGAITAKTAADRLMEQGRQADQKNEVARQRAESQGIRDRAYAAKNNGATVHKAGDRYIGIFPDGRRIDLGPSGGLDRETELDILGEWNVKAAEARGTAAVQTAQAGAIAGNRDLVVIDGQTYQRNPDGGFTPVAGLPRGTPTRPSAPRAAGSGAGTNTLETRRQIQDEMKERYQTDPSSKKYIVQKAGGVFDWKPRPVPAPAGIFPWSADEVTEADVAEYDALRKEVDPSYTPPTTRTAPQQGSGGIGGSTPPAAGGGRGGGTGISPTTPPGGGRGAGTQQKTVSKKEYSPSRNQTRITYSDGTTSIVSGKQ